MASLRDIVKFCEERIQTSSIPDFPGAANGLQVQNNGQVSKVGASVDAGLVPFQKAVEAGVDLLIVHHGLFWGPAYPVTGVLYEKYKLCFENNLAIYSAHLPLDCHPEIGNNALLASKLGLIPKEGFLEHEGNPVGLVTESRFAREELRSRLEALFPAGITSIEKGSSDPKRICILTGSGASAVDEIEKTDADTLITGELRQHHFNQAEERGLNLYACGHYATETFGVTALAKEISERFGIQNAFIPSDCPL
ncbi:MAG: Nif3-like dinuclear metal center hexameric protein [Verrucomicrobiae bacterium]|nr:Nif3-like dinuclear metal center hexameric protein [Verrucomicrobiae bacterium]